MLPHHLHGVCKLWHVTEMCAARPCLCRQHSRAKCPVVKAYLCCTDIPAPPKTATVGNVRLQSSKRSSKASVTATCQWCKSLLVVYTVHLVNVQSYHISIQRKEPGTKSAGMQDAVHDCLQSARRWLLTNKGSSSVCSRAARLRCAFLSCLQAKRALTVQACLQRG